MISGTPPAASRDICFEGAPTCLSLIVRSCRGVVPAHPLTLIGEMSTFKEHVQSVLRFLGATEFTVGAVSLPAPPQLLLKAAVAGSDMAQPPAVWIHARAFSGSPQHALRGGRVQRSRVQSRLVFGVCLFGTCGKNLPSGFWMSSVSYEIRTRRKEMIQCGTTRFPLCGFVASNEAERLARSVEKSQRARKP